MNERFHEDWSPDHSYKWQHNRAVVGHNLKIAWNLMRINSVRPSEKYVELARKIAEIMPPIGSDRQRGGWYDVMEREKGRRPGVVPLHVARPEGVVAAGAGDPRLPDPRRHPRRRGVPAPRRATRPRSTTPGSSTTTRAPSTSTCSRAACRTCSAPSGSRAATRCRPTTTPSSATSRRSTRTC